MAIIVRAGAGEACCIMGLIHIEDSWVIPASAMVFRRLTPLFLLPGGLESLPGCYSPSTVYSPFSSEPHGGQSPQRLAPDFT